MILLKFSTPTCGQCRLVEQQLKKHNIRYEEIDCTSDNGSLIAGYYNVSHVPTILIVDEQRKEIKRFGNLAIILAAIKEGKFNIDNNTSGLIDFL